MATIEIKGVRIGEGIPKTIVSLMADSTDTASFGWAVERLSAPGGILGAPDCIEWRADFSSDIHSPDAIAGICFYLSEALDSQPLIFTCRTKGQGGNVEMGVAEYARLLRTVIETGEPDIVDIELAAGDEVVSELVELAHAKGICALVSYHDFAGTPPATRMLEILAQEVALGADIPKLAVMAQSATDADYLMDATLLMAARLDTPLLTLAMGPEGRITRTTGERFGSALTFCAMGKASAPGQVELREAVEAMRRLHEKLC